MVVDSILAQATFGALGGASLEVLHWYRLSRRRASRQEFRTDPVYWGATAAMILLAAAMPPVYLEGSANALLCFHLGAATPLLLRKLVSATPDPRSPE